MEFDKLYRRILNELNQSTVNSALLKHQSIKDKNPVAKSRAEDFSKRAKAQGSKRGVLIRTTTDPNSKSTSNYANFYIESATIIDEFGSGRSDILLKALQVDPYDEETSKHVELVYYTDSDSLRPWPSAERAWGAKFWLLSRTDAMNLSKTVKKYTDLNVSWKNMDFINSGDYSNQYADTRYDMDKLGK